MTAINTIPEYKDFKEFYIKGVQPLKEQNPSYIRLDGKIKGSTRNVAAYFWYKEKKWKVNADTYIDRLKIAFQEYEKSEEPFVVKRLRDDKGQYLAINGQPVRDMKFYVYSVL